MLEWLNSYMHVLTVLWLFPVVFMLHDFEEILTVEKWTKQNKDEVFKKIAPSLHTFFRSSFQMTTLQFAHDVFWIFLVIIAATLTAVLFSFYFPFLMLLAVFFIHVFTHVGQSVYLGRYTPGVVTAALLVLPYSLYAYYRLLQSGIITGSDIFWSSLVILFFLPFLFLYLIKGRNRAAE